MKIMIININRYLNNGAQVALVGRDIETLSKIGEQFPSQSLVIQCDLGIDLQQYVRMKNICYQFNRKWRSLSLRKWVD
jgi:NADP-dependent 3-hydroxy acid dehydrogenase YdfG